MDNLIKRYIAYPLAVTVFIQDKERFNEFKLGNLYLDMLDSIIDRIQQDYIQLKTDMYSKHHIDIIKLESTKYKVNGKLMEFTPEELKEMTKNLMSEYLQGSKAAGFERKDRIWSD